MTQVVIGTIAWKWQDSEGRIHKFLIPKSFYVKEGNVHLLSPQYWAQIQWDTKPTQGTGSETVADKVTIKHKLTIPLNWLNLAPEYTKFMGFCTKANIDYAKEQDDPIICLPAQAVSDDKESGPEDKYEQQ